MSEERRRELERRWKETGVESDGWSYVFERLRTDMLVLRLIQHVMRIEEGLDMSGEAKLSVEDVIAWLDGELPPSRRTTVVSDPPGGRRGNPFGVTIRPLGVAPAQPWMPNLPNNRGYSREFLLAACRNCPHVRGDHEGHEERRQCLIGHCDCALYQPELPAADS